MSLETKTRKRATITFDPPEDVKQLLAKAQEATGATVTELISEAVRTDLPQVVRKIVDKRRKAEDEFFKLSSLESGGGDNPGHHNPGDFMKRRRAAS